MFFSPKPRHVASLLHPDLPSSLQTRFEPGDGSGRMAIQLQLVPQTDAGEVVLIGDDPVQVAGLWEEMKGVGGCEMPRLDGRTYGDVVLEVFRTPGRDEPQWQPTANPSGDRSPV